MAITKIDFPTASTPSYTPSISTDYNNQNENIERLIRGYNRVSLTNWDGTASAPLVASGSIIEANGVLYDVTTDTAIGTSGASSGLVYLTFNDDDPISFEWVDTAPTWSATLCGWYVSTDRFTGHQLEWDGSTDFEYKSTWVDSITDSGTRLPADGYAGKYGTETIAAISNWVIPAGAYMFSSQNINVALQVNVPSTGFLGVSTEFNGFVISDGVNYRLSNGSGVSATLHYRKLW